MREDGIRQPVEQEERRGYYNADGQLGWKLTIWGGYFWRRR